MRTLSSAYAAAEDIAGAWLLDLLGLPPDSAVGFTATTANCACLAAGRDTALRRAGRDHACDGLADTHG
ncbi:hypothetical protein [Streptomyces lavendulocolor]|uniref:hypothetical protein n=1 Tax=Streptomyces lavendulocolor TaxID=67316 RepID=UPI003C2CE2A3